MIKLGEGAEGTIVEVKVRPKGRRDCVEGQHNGRLVVSVTEAPERDKANRAVARVLG